MSIGQQLAGRATGGDPPPVRAAVHTGPEFVERTFPGSTLDLFRNERNFRTRRPETAQVAVKRAWHEA